MGIFSRSYLQWGYAVTVVHVWHHFRRSGHAYYYVHPDRRACDNRTDYVPLADARQFSGAAFQTSALVGIEFGMGQYADSGYFDPEKQWLLYLFPILRLEIFSVAPIREPTMLTNSNNETVNYSFNLRYLSTDYCDER